MSGSALVNGLVVLVVLVSLAVTLWRRRYSTWGFPEPVLPHGNETPHRPTPPRSRPIVLSEQWMLPGSGLLIGVWAIVPRYWEPFGDVDVVERLEFQDHVIPGAVVLAMSVLGLLTLRSSSPSHLVLLMGGILTSLAGAWMGVNHAPLMEESSAEALPVWAIEWHTWPTLAVALLGVIWSARIWCSVSEEELG